MPNLECGHPTECWDEDEEECGWCAEVDRANTTTETYRQQLLKQADGRWTIVRLNDEDGTEFLVEAYNARVAAIDRPKRRRKAKRRKG